MKIKIEVNDFFKIFPQYEQEVNVLYNKHIEHLEENHFKIEKIKDKKTKYLLNLQLGTKNDFDIKVKWLSNQWEINSTSIEIFTALKLKNDGIILEWDIKSLDNISLLDYLNKTYSINATEYETKNYIGEGIIDWDNITNDVKENWDNSFFFLDNMRDDKFVENNKQLILEKTQSNPEILKEALTGSTIFFNYAMKNLDTISLLLAMKDKPGYLCDIWNKKIKPISQRSNYESMIQQAKNQMNADMESYLEMHRENNYNYENKYGTSNEYDYYEKLRTRLNKELKSKEKDIKIEVEKNKEILKEINEILENSELKYNIVTGLLKNDISKEDFIYFEEMIIRDENLKNIVISNGLYKTLATSKEFVNQLNQAELLKFIENCNKKIEKSYFSTDDTRYFTSIINEDKLLGILQHINKNKELFNNSEWKIFAGVRPKNKELQKELFRINPKDKFSDLAKADITEEDIRLYINAEGYLNEVKSKCNIYELKELETIKLIASKNEDLLNSKKTPNEWKENPEIILALLSGKSNLSYSNLSKENVIALSTNKDFVKEVVKKDKSGSFYKLLPEKIKNDKSVALSLLEAFSNIEDAIKLLPPFILQDKLLNIELIKINSKAIKYLNAEIWNDKEFVLTLFNQIEGTNYESQVKKDLPEKIQFFLETFNIKENYYTFFNNYYLQKKLESNLINEEPKVKEKKMKI